MYSTPQRREGGQDGMDQPMASSARSRRRASVGGTPVQTPLSAGSGPAFAILQANQQIPRGRNTRESHSSSTSHNHPATVTEQSYGTNSKAVVAADEFVPGEQPEAPHARRKRYSLALESKQKYDAELRRMNALSAAGNTTAASPKARGAFDKVLANVSASTASAASKRRASVVMLQSPSLIEAASKPSPNDPNAQPRANTDGRHLATLRSPSAGFSAQTDHQRTLLKGQTSNSHIVSEHSEADKNIPHQAASNQVAFAVAPDQADQESVMNSSDKNVEISQQTKGKRMQAMVLAYDQVRHQLDDTEAENAALRGKLMESAELHKQQQSMLIRVSDSTKALNSFESKSRNLYVKATFRLRESQALSLAFTRWRMLNFCAEQPPSVAERPREDKLIQERRFPSLFLAFALWKSRSLSHRKARVYLQNRQAVIFSLSWRNDRIAAKSFLHAWRLQAKQAVSLAKYETGAYRAYSLVKCRSLLRVSFNSWRFAQSKNAALNSLRASLSRSAEIHQDRLAQVAFSSLDFRRVKLLRQVAFFAWKQHTTSHILTELKSKPMESCGTQAAPSLEERSMQSEIPTLQSIRIQTEQQPLSTARCQTETPVLFNVGCSACPDTEDLIMQACPDVASCVSQTHEEMLTLALPDVEEAMTSRQRHISTQSEPVQNESCVQVDKQALISLFATIRARRTLSLWHREASAAGKLQLHDSVKELSKKHEDEIAPAGDASNQNNTTPSQVLSPALAQPQDSFIQHLQGEISRLSADLSSCQDQLSNWKSEATVWKDRCQFGAAKIEELESQAAGHKAMVAQLGSQFVEADLAASRTVLASPRNMAEDDKASVDSRFSTAGTTTLVSALAEAHEKAAQLSISSAKLKAENEELQKELSSLKADMESIRQPLLPSDGLDDIAVAPKLATGVQTDVVAADSRQTIAVRSPWNLREESCQTIADLHDESKLSLPAVTEDPSTTEISRETSSRLDLEIQHDDKEDDMLYTLSICVQNIVQSFAQDTNDILRLCALIHSLETDTKNLGEARQPLAQSRMGSGIGALVSLSQELSLLASMSASDVVDSALGGASQSTMHKAFEMIKRQLAHIVDHWKSDEQNNKTSVNNASAEKPGPGNVDDLEAIKTENFIKLELGALQRICLGNWRDLTRLHRSKKNAANGMVTALSWRRILQRSLVFHQWRGLLLSSSDKTKANQFEMSSHREGHRVLLLRRVAENSALKSRWTLAKMQAHLMRSRLADSERKVKQLLDKVSSFEQDKRDDNDEHEGSDAIEGTHSDTENFDTKQSDFNSGEQPDNGRQGVLPGFASKPYRLHQIEALRANGTGLVLTSVFRKCFARWCFDCWVSATQLSQSKEILQSKDAEIVSLENSLQQASNTQKLQELKKTKTSLVLASAHTRCLARLVFDGMTRATQLSKSKKLISKNNSNIEALQDDVQRLNSMLQNSKQDVLSLNQKLKNAESSSSKINQLRNEDMKSIDGLHQELQEAESTYQERLEELEDELHHTRMERDSALRSRKPPPLRLISCLSTQCGKLRLKEAFAGWCLLFNERQQRDSKVLLCQTKINASSRRLMSLTMKAWHYTSDKSISQRYLIDNLSKVMNERNHRENAHIFIAASFKAWRAISLTLLKNRNIAEDMFISRTQETASAALNAWRQEKDSERGLLSSQLRKKKETLNSFVKLWNMNAENKDLSITASLSKQCLRAWRLHTKQLLFARQALSALSAQSKTLWLWRHFMHWRHASLKLALVDEGEELKHTSNVAHNMTEKCQQQSDRIHRLVQGFLETKQDMLEFKILKQSISLWHKKAKAKSRLHSAANSVPDLRLSWANRCKSVVLASWHNLTVANVTESLRSTLANQKQELASLTDRASLRMNGIVRLKNAVSQLVETRERLETSALVRFAFHALISHGKDSQILKIKAKALNSTQQVEQLSSQLISSQEAVQSLTTEHHNSFSQVALANAKLDEELQELSAEMSHLSLRTQQKQLIVRRRLLVVNSRLTCSETIRPAFEAWLGMLSLRKKLCAKQRACVSASQYKRLSVCVRNLALLSLRNQVSRFRIREASFKTRIEDVDNIEAMLQSSRESSLKYKSQVDGMRGQLKASTEKLTNAWKAKVAQSSKAIRIISKLAASVQFERQAVVFKGWHAHTKRCKQISTGRLNWPDDPTKKLAFAFWALRWAGRFKREESMEQTIRRQKLQLEESSTRLDELADASQLSATEIANLQAKYRQLSLSHTQQRNKMEDQFDKASDSLSTKCAAAVSFAKRKSVLVLAFSAFVEAGRSSRWKSWQLEGFKKHRAKLFRSKFWWMWSLEARRLRLARKETKIEAASAQALNDLASHAETKTLKAKENARIWESRFYEALESRAIIANGMRKRHLLAWMRAIVGSWRQIAYAHIIAIRSRQRLSSRHSAKAKSRGFLAWKEYMILAEAGKMSQELDSSQASLKASVINAESLAAQVTSLQDAISQTDEASRRQVVALRQQFSNSRQSLVTKSLRSSRYRRCARALFVWVTALRDRRARTVVEKLLTRARKQTLLNAVITGWNRESLHSMIVQQQSSVAHSSNRVRQMEISLAAAEQNSNDAAIALDAERARATDASNKEAEMAVMCDHMTDTVAIHAEKLQSVILEKWLPAQIYSQQVRAFTAWKMGCAASSFVDALRSEEEANQALLQAESDLQSKAKQVELQSEEISRLTTERDKLVLKEDELRANIDDLERRIPKKYDFEEEKLPPADASTQTASSFFEPTVASNSMVAGRNAPTGSAKTLMERAKAARASKTRAATVWLTAEKVDECLEVASRKTGLAAAFIRFAFAASQSKGRRQTKIMASKVHLALSKRRSMILLMRSMFVSSRRRATALTISLDSRSNALDNAVHQLKDREGAVSGWVSLSGQLDAHVKTANDTMNTTKKAVNALDVMYKSFGQTANELSEMVARASSKLPLTAGGDLEDDTVALPRPELDSIMQDLATLRNECAERGVAIEQLQAELIRVRKTVGESSSKKLASNLTAQKQKIADLMEENTILRQEAEVQKSILADMVAQNQSAVQGGGGEDRLSLSSKASTRRNQNSDIGSSRLSRDSSFGKPMPSPMHAGGNQSRGNLQAAGSLKAQTTAAESPLERLRRLKNQRSGVATR